MPERRRTFGPLVLTGLVAAGVTAFAGNQTWAAPDAESAMALPDAGGEMTLTTVLSLVVLACWGVVLVTRGRVRRPVAVLGALAAAGAWVTTLVGWSVVARSVRDRLVETSATDPAVHHTGWWFVAAVAGAVSLAAAVAAVRFAPTWPEMGSRYDAPGEGPQEEAEPADRSSLELWRLMDEGRDPTTGAGPLD